MRIDSIRWNYYNTKRDFGPLNHLQQTHIARLTFRESSSAVRGVQGAEHSRGPFVPDAGKAQREAGTGESGSEPVFEDPPARLSFANRVVERRHRAWLAPGNCLEIEPGTGWRTRFDPAPGYRSAVS